MLTHQRSRRRALRSGSDRNSERGVVLIMTLLMGVLLSAGVSALLINQLFSRRITSSESYQQMAEAAALNGFNRVLALLNNQSSEAYRGFLYTLNNQENTSAPNNGYAWLNLDDPSTLGLEEVCTDTSIDLPRHPSTGQRWPVDEVPLQGTTSAAQRSDAKGKIKAFYRLRGYASPSSTGVGEGIFEIEGIVRRVHPSGTSQPLARTLLTRSLYVNAGVSAPGDWAALAAHHLRVGPAQVKGPGRILHLVDDDHPYRESDGCTNESRLQHAAATKGHQADLGSRIWPVLNRELPASTLFETNAAVDPRLWSIEDDASKAICSAVVCVRTTGEPQPAPGVIIRGNRIRIPRSAICAETPTRSSCHLLIEHFNLTKKRLLIENDTQAVVLRLELPLGSNRYPGMTGRMQFSKRARLCGVNEGSNTCNMQAERLVITSTMGATSRHCQVGDHQVLLGGSNLPAALVSMPRGSLHLTNNSRLQGMIWVHAFCSNNHKITLQTLSSQGVHISEDASRQWQWDEQGFQGVGRMVNRGILGTSLDSFRQW